LTAFAKAGVQRFFIWPVADELHNSLPSGTMCDRLSPLRRAQSSASTRFAPRIARTSSCLNLTRVKRSAGRR
jgi:hypothetical protein